MSSPAPTPSSATRMWPAVVAIVAICGVAGLAIAVVVTRSGSDRAAVDRAIATGDAVVLEPVTYRSHEPFTESLLVDDLPLVAPTSPHGEFADEVTGDTARLYASAAEPRCDKERLRAALGADPALNASWASAAGVEPGAVSGLLDTFTSVSLRTDTEVTNHVYGRDGASPYRAVLQAGTAVLVDPTGLPRVQCSCGNPLLAPQPRAEMQVVGQGWDDFRPDRVVRIAPAPAPVAAFRTVDAGSDEEVAVGAGANAVLDGTLFGTDAGVFVSTPAGEVVQVLAEKVDRVSDDGSGGLIYTLDQPRSGGRAIPVDPRARAVWHLPAGAAEAVEIVPAAQNSWNRLHSVGQLGGRLAILYSPLVEEPALDDDGYYGHGEVHIRFPDTGEDVVLDRVVQGWERGIRSASIGGDRVGLSYADELHQYWAIFDATGALVPGPCAPPSDPTADEDLRDLTCSDEFALDEGGNAAVLLGSSEAYAMTAVDPLTLESIASSTGPNFQVPALMFQVLDGRLVAAPHDVPVVVADFATGTPIDMPRPDGNAHVAWILTAPLVRPVATAGS